MSDTCPRCGSEWATHPADACLWRQVAEVLGWADFRQNAMSRSKASYFGTDPHGHFEQYIPDYPNDGGACLDDLIPWLAARGKWALEPGEQVYKFHASMEFLDVANDTELHAYANTAALAICRLVMMTWAREENGNE